MKITYNWLKDYIDLKVSPKDLIEIFNKLGMPVKEFVDLSKGKENLMVAEIESIERHQKKNNLFILKLKTKKGLYQVVSGAPFLEKGKKVIYAPPGTLLKDLKVDTKYILGEKSEGTVVSEEELGLSDKSETVIFLDDKVNLESDPKDLIGLNDFVFDLEIYPNRPDLLSFIGIARDLSSYLNLEFKIPEIKEIKEDKIDFKIEIDENTGCNRYVGIIIKNLKKVKSPNFLRYRLFLCGIRSINYPVDVSNYVLLETGHPTHVFDLKKIKEKIIVRNARKGENLLCLDGKIRELDETVMVISDNEKVLALAGIIGGENSAVTDETEEVLCESAFFDKINIRKTSKKLNVQTESSYRFERGADFNMVEYAALRLRDLIKELSEGISFKKIDVIRNEIKPKRIFLKENKLKKILGNEFDLDTSKKILERLYMNCTLKNNMLEVIVPTFRRDLELEEDLIEEIARIYGYENFKSEAEEISSFVGKRDSFQDKIRDYFKGEGFLECVSISLIDEREAKLFSEKVLKIKNPLSERFEVLRPSLLPSLLNSLKNNLRRGEKVRKFFEIGKVFYEDFSEEEKMGFLLTNLKEDNWIKESKVDIYFELKGILESFLENFEDEIYFIEEKLPIFNYSTSILINEEKIGYIGEVKEEILSFYDLKLEAVYSELNINKLTFKRDFTFKALPIYPSLSRDLSFVGPENVNASEIIRILKKMKNETLIERFILFDVYKGKPLKEGEKNFTFRVFFRSKDKTLSEREVDKEVERIVKYVEKHVGFKLRG
ncbi:MAG: phenylalanine--tRNA ligase subunit beta [Candidatus Hydrothermales bacterium]